MTKWTYAGDCGNSPMHQPTASDCPWVFYSSTPEPRPCRLLPSSRSATPCSARVVRLIALPPRHRTSTGRFPGSLESLQLSEESRDGSCISPAVPSRPCLLSSLRIPNESRNVMQLPPAMRPGLDAIPGLLSVRYQNDLADPNAKSFSVLARNRTWSTTFARPACPAHSRTSIAESGEPVTPTRVTCRTPCSRLFTFCFSGTPRGIEPRLAESKSAVLSGTLAGQRGQPRAGPFLVAVAAEREPRLTAPCPPPRRFSTSPAHAEVHSGVGVVGQFPQRLQFGQP